MSSSLSSLVWWVVIGLLFFWMMRRGGCGMGHGHRHDRSDRANGHGHPTTAKPIDPVCGMEVEPAKAAGTRVVTGETRFFCSQTCLDAYDKNPSMYAHRNDEHSGHRHHAAC